MKAIEQLERLKKMNRLIKAEHTGNPDEFSRRLGISRRQLYSDIEYLKDMGVEINYSKGRKTFYFCNGNQLEISYSLRIISKDIIKEINGGFFPKNISPCFFYARNEPNLAISFREMLKTNY